MAKVRLGKPVLFAVLALFSLPVFSGCNASKNHLSAFNRYFEVCDYNEAALFAQEKIGDHPTPKGQDLLWTLQLATVERIQGNYQQSSNYFDKSEDMLKYFDEQSRLGDGIGSTAVNDNIIPYRGQEYDGIMVNTYKALNFMAIGDMDLARVEFNRALDRQRRAKENFIEEINKLKSELDAKQQKPNDFSKANIENPKIAELLEQKYSSLHNFEVYPDFVNPFTTWLAGLYFNLEGDRSRAADMVKESCGMVPDNSYIAQDLNSIEESFNGIEAKNAVWLIFENGLGPIKEEFRLDIPLFVATDSVKYVGIALPKLQNRPSAYPYLTVEADGKCYNTEIVADMDRIIQTEFSKDYPGILTRAIISATAKAVAQYAIEKQNSAASSLMSTLAAAYSFATTAADVRIWTTLPKNFQVARFEMPQNRKLKITASCSIALDIDIPQCDNAIVYVRITTGSAVPIYEIMCF